MSIVMTIVSPINNVSQTLEQRNDNHDEKREIQKCSNRGFLEYLLYHEYYKQDKNINLSDLEQKG